MNSILISFSVVLTSYLLGSVPIAYLVTRFNKGIDIRKVGDYNIGASNVAREVSPGAGWLVLIGDVAKGAAALMIAKEFSSEPVVLTSGIAVVAGHNWSVFMKFKGGRGMSTVIGVLFVLLPLPMSIVSVVGVITLLITNSLVFAGLITFIPLVILSWIFGVSAVILIYAIILLSSTGIMHLLTTRHLTKIQKNEALRWKKKT